MDDARTAFAFLLKRERAIVLVALIAITLLAWTYLLFLSAEMQRQMPQSMPGMQAMDMPAMMSGFTPWSWQHAVSQFAMWSVMMVGMMTPSVVPMVLVYTRVADDAASKGTRFAPPVWFVLGYLLAWSLFGGVATASQWGLERAALLTPALASANRLFGGSLLIIVGAYQWSPLKDSCLMQCRFPLSFIQRHGGFQPRASASTRLGLLHGAFCVGCCWALMALLFVAGVMNLFWVAAIMVFVLAEKIVPFGSHLSRIAGTGAVVAGVMLLATG